MKSNLIEYPCICGHWKVDHMIDGYGTILNFDGSSICIWSDSCKCPEFKADNLTYLESFIDDDNKDV